MVTKKKVTKVKEEKVASEATVKAGCTDRNCHVHGALKTRGQVFEGVVVSDKMQKTVSVQWSRQIRVPKYERFLLKKSKIKAHCPPCIIAKMGDRVRIAECRPIAKTVNFVVIEVLK